MNTQNKTSKIPKASKAIELSEAIAQAVRQCNVDVVTSYPITPQTHIVEKLSKFKANGKLKGEFVNLESEHSSMSACIGASASGSRVFTATSSQGLMYMAEMLPIASGLRLPIVMVNANRAISAPINIWNDHSDSMFVRDSGWIQIHCESVQEAYDTLIQSYKIAENKQISLPVMICIDGFSLSHVMENVSLLEDKEIAMFVGKFSPITKLESKNPKTFGHVASPKDYYLFKQEQVEAIENSLAEIKKINLEFSQKFKRKYGDGLIEEYNTKNAETVFIALGSICSTIKGLINENKFDKKVGLVRIKTFRPFPKKEIEKIFSNTKIKKIVVIDRSNSFGSNNPVYSEIKQLDQLCLNKKEMKNFVLGLGGKNITDNEFIELVDNFDKFKEVNIL